jgi:hypothetical protein
MQFISNSSFLCKNCLLMKNLILPLLLVLSSPLHAQRSGPPRGEHRGGPRPENLTESPADLGSAGIAWYPILKDGLAEAQRTNKPILFMAVASQCSGISGVF